MTELCHVLDLQHRSSSHDEVAALDYAAPGCYSDWFCMCFSRNLLTGRSIPFILKNSVSPACDCVYSTAFSSTQWPRLAVSTGAITV